VRQKESLVENNPCFYSNLDAIRDWGHAKDYLEGMWRILQHSEPDDFVLVTGQTFIKIDLDTLGLLKFLSCLATQARLRN